MKFPRLNRSADTGLERPIARLETDSEHAWRTVGEAGLKPHILVIAVESAPSTLTAEHYAVMQRRIALAEVRQARQAHS